MTDLAPLTPFSPPQPNAEAIPTADVHLPTTSGDYRHAAYPVKRPEEEINEFMVECRATTLMRCREKLSAIRDSSFPWHEFLLVIASLAIGTSLGALSSEVTYTGDPTRWKFLFMFLPFVGLGTGIAYLFLRHQSIKVAVATAREILEDLPDPNNSK
jgi:hypothetical protein